MPERVGTPGSHGRDRRASGTEAVEDYAKAIHALAEREPGPVGPASSPSGSASRRER